MSKKTATLVQENLPNYKGAANHYRLSEPLDGHTEVIVSAVDEVIGSYPIKETYIFPATSDGKVADWGELYGSMKDTTSHTEVLEGIGYEVKA